MELVNKLVSHSYNNHWLYSTTSVYCNARWL